MPTDHGSSARDAKLASVLIAARNESRHVEKCLQSLLAQSYPHIEIIVIDDGSTDDTAQRALQSGVRVLSQLHSGKARVLAAGARIAAGKALLFLDADMIFDQDYVRHLVTPIFSAETVGTAHAIEHVANPENRSSRCWQRQAGLPLTERLVIGDEEFRKGSQVFRAVESAAFHRVGGFDDIGYLDDQTLAPKLGCRALWIREAICSHYNVESLAEVAALGRWASVALAREKGVEAKRRFLPPVIALRALLNTVRLGPAMAAYRCAWEWGAWTGLRHPSTP